MPADLVLSFLNILLGILRNQRTRHDIERELNDQLSGREWSLTSYEGQDTTLRIESVTVRAKYFPREEGRGVEQVEGDNFFTKLENKRSNNTFRENLHAIIKNRWITIIRVNIDSGDADILRPPGLNLSYITATRSIRFTGQLPIEGSTLTSIPQVRIAQTHELQSDKLEMKVRYDGSVGEYSQRVSDAIDLLRDVQDDMDHYVLRFLLERHHSGKIGEGEFSWPDEEQAEKLGEFLTGYPVDTDALAKRLEQLNEDMRKSEETDN